LLHVRAADVLRRPVPFLGGQIALAAKVNGRREPERAFLRWRGAAAAIF
jgi:hypothetical protein